MVATNDVNGVFMSHKTTDMFRVTWSQSGPGFTLGFYWGSCYSIFSCMCMFCRWLFVLLSFYLFTIVFSVLLRYTDSDYPFGIFLLRFWLVDRVARRVPHLEQELLSIPEQLNLPSVLSDVRVTRSFVFCVIFCRSLCILLSYLSLPCIICLS